MVGWYNPVQLFHTAFEVLISTIFGKHADRRLLESLVDSNDLNKKLYFDFFDKGKKEMWLDYISDVGDGFDSTYTMAYHLARPQLDLPLVRNNQISHSTKQGEILIFGGDEVYPTAGMKSYSERLIDPYKAAYSRKDSVIPSIFAIPGNHDWYDSLVSFSRVFCEGHKFFGTRTMQNRSYFALRLIKGWWLFGTDMQLGSSLDKPQVEYFTKVMNELKPDDRIILCNAEPYWLYSTLYKNDLASDNRNMGFFEGHVLQNRAVVYIAGDRHYYRRHENSETSKQKIIAGGGGAFLHPTHKENVEQIGRRDKYDLKATFPDTRTSQKLGWMNLLFPFLNPWFGIVTGILYLLTARAFLSNLGKFGLSDILQTLGIVLHDAIVQPVSLYWVLAIFIGFLVFTDTYSKLYRFVAGPLHGLVHLVAVFLISWGASYFISSGRGLDFNSNGQLLLAGLVIFIGGYFTGSLIIGIYLFVSLNFFGRHHNEAFSSLKIADYKNFLRLKIEENGDLIIYPVGIRKVARKWKDNSDLAENSKVVPNDRRATSPELIEEPIFISQVSTHLKNANLLNSDDEQQNTSDPRIKEF